MHKKYVKDGLAAVSVSLDDKNSQGKVLDFLKKQNADFTNLILDEEFEVLKKNLNVPWTPYVIVYGRDGTIARKFDDVDFAEVEKTVAELVKKN